MEAELVSDGVGYLTEEISKQCMGGAVEERYHLRKEVKPEG